MRLIRIIFLSSFLCFSSVEAQHQIDSLEQALQKVTVDSEKIEILEKLQVHYRKIDIQKHKEYILMGLEVSKRNNWTQKEGIFTRELGINFKNIDVLDSSLYYYQKAKNLFENVNDTVNYYVIKASIANIKKKQGKYEEAIAYLIDCIQYNEHRTDKKGQLNAQISKLNLANIYFNLKEYDKAIKNYTSVAKSPIATSNTALARMAYTNLSAMYVKKKELDSALYYAQKSENILKGSKLHKSLGNLYTNMGAIYEQKGNYQNAIAYFSKALTNYTTIKSTSGIIKSYNNLGNVHSKLGKFSIAEEYLLNAKKLLLNVENIHSLASNYKMLVSLYEKTNNYKKAYETKKILTQLNDSILSIEKRKAIHEIETKYEVEKKTLETQNALKDKEVAELNAAKNRNYLIYGTAIATLCVLCLILYLIFFKAKKKQQITALNLKQTKKKLELEKLYRNSELKALKAQMNPHFMFNAMNSIQSLILKGDRDEAYTYLTKLATLIRENLNLSEKNFIYFDQELTLLKTYLELEKLRFTADFEYEIINADSIEDIKIPAMIIQPFVENAIKHGLLHTTGAKKLQISFHQSNILTCIVEDNGIGRKASEKLKAKKPTHSSFATSAIAKRFALLKEYYKVDLGFAYEDIHAENTIAGTRVTIKIPFLNE